MRRDVAFAKKISHYLGVFAEVVSSVFILNVTVVLAVQVFLRFFLKKNLPWAEELARYMTIWAVMMSSSILIKNNELLKVDFLDVFWPKWLIKYRDLVYKLILLAVFALIIREGWIQAVESTNMRIPSMNLSWFWPYLAIPFGFLLSLCQSLLTAYSMFFDEKDPGKGM